MSAEVNHVPSHRLVADAESFLPLGQPACGIFYDRERFGQNLIEPLRERVGILNGGELGVPSRRFRTQIFV